MAEVIGDDLNAFIKTSKEKGSVPADFDVPFAHTPAFVGSHITGYDNALLGVLQHFWDGKAKTGAAAGARARRQHQLHRRLRRFRGRQHEGRSSASSTCSASR
jgi:nitrogenase molybdenum-iron protein beta chain